MTLAEFVNKLIWDVEGQPELEKFKKEVDNLSKNLGQKLRRGFIVAGAAAAAFGGNAFRAAAAAEELDSQLGVVFDENADSVRAWAEATGDALGRSTQEIQRGVVAFQSLFDQAIGGDEAVQLSKDFAVLTQDLASFKDLSNEVAQQKLFSGLSGEAEPLRQVGVFLNAAAVEAKALELGLARSKKELTDQNKIVARAALIQEALADASGDVIRTSDSATNTLKTLSAEFEELNVAIGQDLIPLMRPLIAGAISFVKQLKEWNDQSGGLIANIIAITAAIGAFLVITGPFISFIVTVVKLWALYTAGVAAGTIATGAFTAVAAPLILIILAIIAAVTAVILIWKNWDSIVKRFRETWARLPGPLKAVAAILTGPIGIAIGAATLLFKNFGAIVELVSGFVSSFVEKVQNAAAAVTGFVRDNPFALAALGPAGLAVGGAAQAARTVSNIRNNNGNSVSQTVNAEINVRGGNTNAQTGAAVRDALYDGPRTARLNRDLVGPVGL